MRPGCRSLNSGIDPLRMYRLSENVRTIPASCSRLYGSFAQEAAFVVQSTLQQDGQKSAFRGSSWNFPEGAR